MRALAALALLALTACSPQIVYMKMKEVDRTVPPPDGRQVDTFQYQTPFGHFDVVFVADSTDYAHSWAPVQPNGASIFETHYNAFLTEVLGLPNQLGYLVQVITTPTHNVSSSYIQPGSDPSQQLNDLFSGTSPIFSFANPDYGDLDPVGATTTALLRKEFQGWQNRPLFLVYALGKDVTDPNIGQELVTGLPSFGPFQTSITALTALGSTSCGTAVPAPTFLSSMSAQTWATPVSQVDLCDPSWGNLESQLFTQITGFMSRIILTQTPYEPELMNVTTESRSYVFNADYTYNKDTHEITFNANANLKAGDKINVGYYTMPPANNPQQSGAHAGVPIPGGT